jgi:hypothetical protein
MNERIKISSVTVTPRGNECAQQSGRKEQKKRAEEKRQPLGEAAQTSKRSRLANRTFALTWFDELSRPEPMPERTASKQ